MSTTRTPFKNQLKTMDLKHRGAEAVGVHGGHGLLHVHEATLVARQGAQRPEPQQQLGALSTKELAEACQPRPKMARKRVETARKPLKNKENRPKTW